MKNKISFLTAWLLACSLSMQAFADDTQLTGYDEDTLPQTQPEGEEWHFVAGAVAASVPRYEGAQDSRAVGIPLFDASYGNFFAGDLRGIGYLFVKERDVQFGVRLGAAPRRLESTDTHLAGLGDLDTSGEAGLFFKTHNDLGYFTIKAAGGKRGRHAELGAGLDFRPAPRDILRLGASVGWANADYMQAYFGVDAVQAAHSGLSAYAAAGGLHNYALLTSWTHVFDRHWLGSIALAEHYLAGSARNSPVVLETAHPVVSAVALYLF